MSPESKNKPAGVLAVNKPAGITSQQVVTRVKRALKYKKAGHAGTLDPEATGVLLICLSEATKLFEALQAHEKEYVSVVKLGVETNTYDMTGEVVAERESARAGHSEHQLGQTVDVTSAAVGWQLSQDLGATPEGVWLHAHLAEFGFALSYPPGMEETTGYIYEPWHLRYVGTSCAAEWQASGLTLIEVLRGDHLGG